MAFGGGSERSVKVNLKANVSDYVGKVTAAGKATKNFADNSTKSAMKHKEAWSRLGTGMLVTGGVIAAGIGLAVKSYADFDQKLSTVRAVSGATASEMKLLSAAALKAGADTKYSASQAAEAEGELAKLGVSTADILGGALTGALNLAAAGNLNLADAATYAGQAMKIFNLAGKDVPHIADVLAAGANKSAADVQTLAQAMQQGGLVAAQTGLTLEDTVGVLSAFSDNALNGSDAGTSFKTMLQRLNPQSDTAKNLMDQLGLSAYDAQGNFIGITKYAGNLQRALGKMSAEQRNAALQTLFGSDAVRAANVLYKEGAAGIDKYIKGVNDQGAAAAVAATQMDNLNGDIEQLRGSIETALIKAGSQGNDVLRALTQTATSLVNIFGSVPAPITAGAMAAGALTAAALLTAGALTKLRASAASARTTLVELGITSETTASRLGTLAKSAGAVGAAVAGVSVAGSAFDEFIGRTAKGTDEAGRSLLAYAKAGREAKGVTDLTSSGFKNLDKTVTYGLRSGKWNQVKEFFSDFGTLGIGQTGVDEAKQFFAELDNGLANLASSGNGAEAQKVFQQVAKAAQDQGYSVQDVIAKLPQYEAALKGATAATESAAQPTEELGGIVNGVAISAEDAGKAIDDYVKALQDAGLVQLSARDAARGFQQALDDADEAIKKNGRSLDISTQKGRDNQKALDDVAKAALDQAQALYESTKSTKGEEAAKEVYRQSLIKSRSELVRVAEKFGLSKAAAKKFADQLLQIPAKVSPEVSVRGADAATTKAKALRDALLGIKNRHVTVDVTTRTANKLAANPALTRAEGGPVYGPGSSTSDSIPAYLSNGEYVVKAAAVDKYGSAFFDRLNSMRFASGGLVGSVAAAAPVAAGSSTTFQVYGVDAEAAAMKALRKMQYLQVPR